MRIVSPTGKKIYYNSKRIKSITEPEPPEPPVPPPPEGITIDGRTYTTVKIGNQMWTCEDLNLNLNTSLEYHNNNVGYYEKSTLNVKINEYLQTNGLSNWRVPTHQDMTELLTFIKTDNNLTNNSQTCYYLYKVGSSSITSIDKYGFALLPNGAYDNGMGLVNIGFNANIGYTVENKVNYTYRSYFLNGGAAYGEGDATGYKVVVRLVSNVEV